MSELSESGEFRYISAGAIIGGLRPSAKAWKASISAWSRRLRSRIDGASGPLAVSIVFLVPGESWEPEFASPKITAFRKRMQQLEVQIPLPDDVPDDPGGFLTLAALDAINVIQVWADKRKRSQDVVPIRTIVADI